MDSYGYLNDQQPITNPKHNMIDKLFFPIGLVLQGIVNAAANIYNGNQSRKLTQELEERKFSEAKEAEERRIAQKTKDDIEAHKRAIEIIERNNLETFRKLYEERTGILYYPGGFVKTVLRNPKSIIVLFDTNIQNLVTNKDEHFIFNPMAALHHSFKKHLDSELAEKVSVTDIHQSFKAHSTVQAFYNQEMEGKSAIIIFGNFDGNFLRLYAVFGGVLIDQFNFNAKGELAKGDEIRTDVEPKSIPILDVPLSLLRKDGFSDSEQQIQRENLQLAINILSATILQSLLDFHFTIKEPSYVPRIGKEFVSPTQELAPLFAELNESMSQQKENIIEQQTRLKQVRHKYQRKFLIDP